MLFAFKPAQAQGTEKVIMNGASRDYPALYAGTRMTTANHTVDGPGIPASGNIVSSILTPGAMYNAHFGHYLSFLYKQVLCICSLYWLLAGYRRYRPNRIADNSRNLL